MKTDLKNIFKAKCQARTRIWTPKLVATLNCTETVPVAWTQTQIPIQI